MASKPKPHYNPGSGDVEIQLGEDGEHTLTLRCTLQAALAISRLAGGIRGAMTQVTAMDYDTIATVLRHGLGPEVAKKYKNLEQLVYENGMMDNQGQLLAKCVEYLSNLARGGKSAEDAELAAAKRAESGEDPQTTKEPTLQ